MLESVISAPSNILFRKLVLVAVLGKVNIVGIFISDALNPLRDVYGAEYVFPSFPVYCRCFPNLGRLGKLLALSTVIFLVLVLNDCTIHVGILDVF